MNHIAKIGDNRPPSQIETILSKHLNLLGEIESWQDGEKVETEEQMLQVDDMIKSVKIVVKELKSGKENEWRPVKNEADTIAKSWKTPTDEWEAHISGLNALVLPYKIAREKERQEAQRAQQEEARRLEREAREAKENLDMSNIEERREADELAAKHREASRGAQAIKADKTSGLMTRKVAVITDPKALLNFVAKNDREAVVIFLNGYVSSKRTNDEKAALDGVELKDEVRAV